MVNMEPSKGGERTASSNHPEFDARHGDAFNLVRLPEVFTRTTEVELVLNGPALDPLIEKRIQDRGGLRWANIYPGTLDQVVVGSDQCHYPTHASVHMGLLRVLTTDTGRYTMHDLENSKVDGFKDGPNYVVRIEDHGTLLDRAGSGQNGAKGMARAELQELLRKYTRAIELAGIACQGTGGQVFLQAEGSSQIQIAKMLGRLHQASSQENLPGAVYAARSRQITDAGEFFYSRSTGTRYKTADQLERLAVPEEHPEFFIRGLEQMYRWMTTDNQRGNREAQFLIIDPVTGELVSRGATVEQMLLMLEDLIDNSKNLLERGWKKSVPEVREMISDMSSYLRSLNHVDFKQDLLSNTVFVQKLSEILRRGGRGLELGPGFSTPLKAVEIGHFKVTSQGERVFVHSTSDTEHERIISWVERKFPQVAKADSLNLCLPEIPLTFDHHPSSFVSSFGATPDRSFVVLFGRLGEPETRIVVRRNDYAESSWPERETPRVHALLEHHTPEFLTQAVRFFQENQYFLAKVIGQASGSTHSLESDVFEPIQLDETYGKMGDYEYRPFYDGKRVDLESLMSWPEDRIRGALACVGEIIAKNIIKQAPVLSFSSLVIAEESELNNVPLKIRTLSESETFCHSLDIKGVRKYLSIIPKLYGAHIAVWVESFCQGRYGKGDGKNSQELQRLRSGLIRTCLSQFERTWKTLSGSGRPRFDSALRQVGDEYSRYEAEHGSLPQELDMRRYLKLSSEILSQDHQKLMRSIRNEASYYCNLIVDALSETGAQSPTKLREDVVDAMYSLVSNHFSDGARFGSISSLLTRDRQAPAETAYTLKERLWLYTVVDVGAWLSEAKMSDRAMDLLKAAIQSPNVDTFLENNRELIDGINLAPQTVIRFYESVDGLRHSLRELREGHPKRAMLQRDMRMAYSLRGLNKDF